MKPIIYHKYSSSGDLELHDIDEPVVKDGEVLKRLAYLGPLVASLPLHFLWKPLRFFPDWWIGPAVGLPLVMVGVLLLAWAIRTMFRAGEDPDPERPTTAIVANGPYALSRNPIYVSFNAVYVGIALLVNTVWPIIFLPIGIALLHYRVIAREESYLERVFGDEYLTYKARVRRWV